MTPMSEARSVDPWAAAWAQTGHRNGAPLIQNREHVRGGARTYLFDTLAPRLISSTNNFLYIQPESRLNIYPACQAWTRLSASLSPPSFPSTIRTFDSHVHPFRDHRAARETASALSDICPREALFERRWTHQALPEQGHNTTWLVWGLRLCMALHAYSSLETQGQAKQDRTSVLCAGFGSPAHPCCCEWTATCTCHASWSHHTAHHLCKCA